MMAPLLDRVEELRPVERAMKALGTITGGQEREGISIEELIGVKHALFEVEN